MVWNKEKAEIVLRLNFITYSIYSIRCFDRIIKQEQMFVFVDNRTNVRI
jgi:hypothetical protein